MTNKEIAEQVQEDASERGIYIPIEDILFILSPEWIEYKKEQGLEGHMSEWADKFIKKNTNPFQEQ